MDSPLCRFLVLVGMVLGSFYLGTLACKPEEAKPILVGAQAPDHLKDEAEKGGLKMRDLVLFFGVGILVFSLIICCGIHSLFASGKLSEASAVRFASLLVLATLASFLVVAGYSSVQLSAAMTLLGTLAGYIFGRGDTASGTPPVPPTQGG